MLLLLRVTVLFAAIWPALPSIVSVALVTVSPPAGRTTVPALPPSCRTPCDTVVPPV